MSKEQRAKSKEQRAKNKEQRTKSKFLQIFAFCFLLFALLLPLLWNLLRPGFYTSHDGEWMAIRLTAFHQAWRDGQLPVRWLPRLNHGYGYPVANFLYPLPFYLAEPVYILTRNPATAVQAMMGLSVVSAAVGMYLFLQSRGKLIATGGALAYVYSPYIAYNLYIRGSLGELVALGIVPWIFWAIKTRRLSLSALLIAGLITAHNVVALLLLPLVAWYLGLRSYRTYKSYMTYMPYLLLAIGVSAFFWLPALTELRYVRASLISVADFDNEYLTLNQAIKLTGPVVALSHLGIPVLLFSQISSRLWNLFSPLKIIQFPWRLLSLFSFTGVLISVLWIEKTSQRKVFQFTFIVFILFISFMFTKPFLVPKDFIDRPPGYYETNDDTTTARAEYTPIWVKQLPPNLPPLPAQHYYPGWRAFANGYEIPLVDPNQTNGVMEVVASPKGDVRFVYSETPRRTVANLMTASSLLVLLKTWRRRQNI